MRVRSAIRPAVYTIAIIFILTYMIGGLGGFRSAMSRVRSWMFPTQQEVQRSVVRDTTPVAPAAAPPPPLPVRLQKTRFSEPPSTAAIAALVGSIFVAALGAMYVTGRSKPS